MPVTTCAWCRARASMTRQSNPVDARESPRVPRIQAAFQCNHCKMLSVATVDRGVDISPSYAVNDSWWNEHSVEWTPQSVGGKDFPDVPDHIAGAANEAYRCRSIQALRAAILLARSVVEATAKERGHTTGTLFAKIDALHKAEDIRGHTKDAAHELRFLGNDMAHGDFVNAVDDADADEVLAVMSEILNEVFQGPARVARMRAKREALS